MDDTTLLMEIEPDGSRDYGPCECCGNMSRTVWGFVHTPKRTLAAYYVSWTLGRLDHGAHLDLVLGKWDEGSNAQDRFVVSLAFRMMPEGPSFMVIDAAGRPAADGAIAALALARDQVIATSTASEVFAIVDAIYLKDRRLANWREDLG